MIIAGLNGNIDGKPMGQKFHILIGVVDSIFIHAKTLLHLLNHLHILILCLGIKYGSKRYYSWWKRAYRAVTRQEFLKIKK